MAEKKHWPNGPVIEELMRAKGFGTADDLAHDIEDAVSSRSIQVMITGLKKHKESTLQIVADALGVPLKEITIDKPNTECSDTTNNFEEFREQGSNRTSGSGASATLIATDEIDVEVEVDESFDARTDERDAAFTQGIRLMLQRARSVRITRVPRSGSVIYTIRLTREEAAELEKLRHDKKLEHLKVLSIRPVNDASQPIALAPPSDLLADGCPAEGKMEQGQIPTRLATASSATETVLQFNQPPEKTYDALLEITLCDALRLDSRGVRNFLTAFVGLFGASSEDVGLVYAQRHSRDVEKVMVGLAVKSDLLSKRKEMHTTDNEEMLQRREDFEKAWKTGFQIVESFGGPFTLREILESINTD